MTASDQRGFVVGRLLGIDTAANRARVSIDGSSEMELSFIPGAYDGVTLVWVIRDPYRTGSRSASPSLVLGPCYQEAPDIVPPPPPKPAPEASVTATALIRPVGSGTYRSIRGAWDRWNVDMYGGRTDLYQGNAYGSGPLIGLAWYGDQVVNLGALSITAITVATPRATGSGNAVLQGAPHASRPAGAPAPTGDTASGDASTVLTAAQREAFRTGAAKSLATVGGNYRGTYGSAHPSGMALSITYQKPT